MKCHQHATPSQSAGHDLPLYHPHFLGRGRVSSLHYSVSSSANYSDENTSLDHCGNDSSCQGRPRAWPGALLRARSQNEAIIMINIILIP